MRPLLNSLLVWKLWRAVESLPSEKHLQVLALYTMLLCSCRVFGVAEAIAGLDPAF